MAVKTPFEHQISGSQFLIEKRKCILADVMGIGKSFTTIMACLKLAKPNLVICPASLKINWAREIVSADPEAHIQVVNAGEIGNITEYNVGHGSQWLIINYDLLKKYREEIRIILPYKTIILDEAHYIKEASNERSKESVALCKSAENIFLVTGTPILNRPIELYNLLKAIGHPLGDNWYSYAKKYCGAFEQKFKKWVLNEITGKKELREMKFLNVQGATNLDDLQKQIAPFYLRRTKAVLGKTLPPKIVQNIEIELDEKSKQKYNGVWELYMRILREELAKIKDPWEAEKKRQDSELARHLVELQKMKQVCSQAKIPRIIADALNIVEQGEKVIIFTQYTETLETIKNELAKKKVKCVSISGSDDQMQRQKAIDGFQNSPAVKVFVGNIKAAGVGITLTEASVVLFADMEWTPALHEQCEDRAHRIGQDSLVNIYYYVAKDTIEQDIIDALDRKAQIISAILSGDTKRLKNLSVAGEVIRKLGIKLSTEDQ